MEHNKNKNHDNLHAINNNKKITIIYMPSIKKNYTSKMCFNSYCTSLHMHIGVFSCGWVPFNPCRSVQIPLHPYNETLNNMDKSTYIEDMIKQNTLLCILCGKYTVPKLVIITICKINHMTCWDSLTVLPSHWPPSHWSPSHWSSNTLLELIGPPSHWFPVSLFPHLIGPPFH